MVETVAPSRFTVLLPDEVGGWHQTLARLLEPQGVQAKLARSGREALGLIETTDFHAVVLDTKMPQLGGLQVVKLMNDRLVNRAIPPVILLAHELSSHLLREALSMGVFSVLAKPVNCDILLDALARLLRRYHENRWPGGRG